MLTSDQASHDQHSHDEHLVHLPHCFDYLRQAVMCAADTSLEPTHIVPGSEVDGVPSRSVGGWGVTHLCRKYKDVWEFAKDHRYRNDSGIL